MPQRARAARAPSSHTDHRVDAPALTFECYFQPKPGYFTGNNYYQLLNIPRSI